MLICQSEPVSDNPVYQDLADGRQLFPENIMPLPRTVEKFEQAF